MNQIYYDTFTDEVVDYIPTIRPPERYIRIHCGTNTFIEKWFCGNNMFLNIAYSDFERKQGFVNQIRTINAEKNNVNLLYITDWTVTEDHYKKMERAVKE